MVRVLSGASSANEDFEALLHISRTALLQEFLHPRSDEHGCLQVVPITHITIN